MTDGPLCCLTLDLENDWEIDEPGFDHLTFEYIEEFVNLITDLDVPLSVFVVGRTLEKHPEDVDRLREALDCEFHLHSYGHDMSKSYDFQSEVRRGKDAFRAHFGHDPIGYRAPQGNIDPGEFSVLEEERFEFDSSVFPSYRPGVYNNVTKPRRPFVPNETDDLLEIPLGTTGTRIPTSHNYVKLFGWPMLKYLSVSTLPDPLVYNVHLQDLYRTPSHDKLPSVKRRIFKRNLDRSVEMFRSVVKILRGLGYDFGTMTDVLERERDQNPSRGHRAHVTK